MSVVEVALPRPLLVLRLLLGRGAFRAGVQVTALALVTVWDGRAFSLYAGAVGQCAWLLLVSDAPEKAALKTLPRTPRLGPSVVRLSLAMSAAPALALVTAVLVAAFVAPRAALTAYLAAGAWSACTGVLMTVSGLHRARGRPIWDTVAFGASGAVVLAATVATVVTGWAPQVHLLLVLAGTVAVTLGAIAALPRTWVRPAPRRRLLGKLVRLTLLLGAADLFDALCFALAYLVLTLSGQADQSGVLYLALLGPIAICQVVVYLLRVAQPATSHRLRGTRGREGRAHAVRLLRRAEIMGAPLVVLVVAMAGLPYPVGLVVMAAVVVTLFLTVMYAGYLVENTTNDVLTVTASGALVGLVATGLLAALLVPLEGAAGAMAALALAIPIKAHVMRRKLTTE
ncbi:hypothetical protein ACIBG8_12025 [Nonomuraea sp. NPDC050556]|uniref:hypothetical protein n=1 Tax=Nonomuraea sp. NPDC050556 TaxID=3364369 RepID=UPI0037B35093